MSLLILLFFSRLHGRSASARSNTASSKDEVVIISNNETTVMIEDQDHHHHLDEEDLDLNESDVDALGLLRTPGGQHHHLHNREDVSPDMSHVSVVVVGGENKDVQVNKFIPK